MDVFKLAFETIIVGLLTFIWLGLATYFLFPDLLKALPVLIDSKERSTIIKPHSEWAFLPWPTA